MNMLIPISVSNFNFYPNEVYRFLEKIYENCFTNFWNISEGFEIKSVSSTHLGGKDWKENSMYSQTLVGRDITPQLLDELAPRFVLGWNGMNLLKHRRDCLREERLCPFDTRREKKLWGSIGWTKLG